jgi:O-antigen/teichoic acid export membrane protein
MIIHNFKNFLKTRTLKETIFVFSGALINGGLIFLINSLLGQKFSKEWFGIFSLVIMTLSVAAELSDFGLNGGMLRFGPYYLNSGEDGKFIKMMKVIWSWRVKISIVLTIGGILLSYPISQYIFGQPQIYKYLSLSFVGIGGVILLGFICSYLQVQQKFLLNSILQSLKGVTRFLLVAIFLLAGSMSLYFYIGAFVFAPWIVLAGYLFFHPAIFIKEKVGTEERREINKKLGNFGFWLAINSFFVITAGKIDQIMVSHILDLEQLAIFSVALQFLYFYTIGLQSIGTVITPKVNSFRNRMELKHYIMKSFKIIVPVFFAGLILIYPTKFLILLFFGQKYIDSIIPYLILSYSTLCGLLFLPFGFVLTVYSKTNLVALSGVMQFVINIILNWLFIRAYGVIGAAIAYGISSVLINLYYFFCSMYLIKHKEIIV